MKRLTALAAVALAIAATSLMAADKKQDRRRAKDGSGTNCTITQTYGICQAVCTGKQQRRGGGGGSGDRQQKHDGSCTE